MKSTEYDFSYECTNPQCEIQGIILASKVTDDRKCKSCGKHVIDHLLYNGDENCKHAPIKNNWSGVKCKKCDGWFCY